MYDTSLLFHFSTSLQQNLYSTNHFTIKLVEGMTEFEFNILIADWVAFTSNPLMANIIAEFLLRFNKGRNSNR